MRIIVKYGVGGHSDLLEGGSVAVVLAVNRFRVPEPESVSFREELAAARDVLAAQAGYLDGTMGRNVDDPGLWVLVTRWESVGAYRRALSAYDVKLHAWPLLYRAIEEPGAYESAEPGADLNTAKTRSLG
jgi:quinol monooxygenase YgiN